MWGYLDPNFQLIFTLSSITHLWGGGFVGGFCVQQSLLDSYISYNYTMCQTHVCNWHKHCYEIGGIYVCTVRNRLVPLPYCYEVSDTFTLFSLTLYPVSVCILGFMGFEIYWYYNTLYAYYPFFKTIFFLGDIGCFWNFPSPLF